MESKTNRLILVGNGFDLAHGLKTGYDHFIHWFFQQKFSETLKRNEHEDELIKFSRSEVIFTLSKEIKNMSLVEIFEALEVYGVKVTYKHIFFKTLVENVKTSNWVDIESYYYKHLKRYFLRSGIVEESKVQQVLKLNLCFNLIIKKFTEYLTIINSEIDDSKIRIVEGRHNLYNAIAIKADSDVIFLNFNYTDTLLKKGYANENECVFIHGNISDLENNPIIFGYGDESDPAYQEIEDSGNNVYLEHIKSFGYLQTKNYQKLISYIDSGNKFDVFILGHSCGLSDRILLREVFEHKYCNSINVFYHQKANGSDNFKEITQEISRHFRPENKNIMRRKILPKDSRNKIPQLNT